MAKIEHYVKPHRLYRYRSLEHVDRELETIERAYLFCSAYKDLNDPMATPFEYRLAKSSIFFGGQSGISVIMAQTSEAFGHS